jgi:hypothetical protein
MPQGQPRDDDEPGLAEIVRQLAREFQPGTRGVARADDREHRPGHGCEVAAHTEQRRGIVDKRQARRITDLVGRHQFDAESVSGIDLAPCVVFGRNPARAAPPRRHVRRALERGAGRTEMIDERAKGARADIFGADQPQSVDPLRLRQTRLSLTAAAVAHAHAPQRECCATSGCGQFDTGDGGRPGYFFSPIRPSVPACSRVMFSRCM